MKSVCVALRTLPMRIEVYTLTNEQLVEEIQTGSGEQNRQRYEQLWEQCQAFVGQQAIKWTGYAEREDLIQQGYIILHDTAVDYNPEAGMQFITYLGHRLSWGWARWIEETGQPIRLPSYMVQQILKLERVRKDYIQKYSTEPDESALSSLLGVEPKTVRLITETAQKSRLRSLNEVIEAEDGSGSELGEQIPDSIDLEAECIERIQNQQLAMTVWPLVDELADRQSEVIYARYKRNISISEIAEEREEPRGETQRNHDAGIRELRKPQRVKKLRPFMDDVRMRPLYGTGLTHYNHTWESAPEREAIKRWFRDA